MNNKILVSVVAVVLVIGGVILAVSLNQPKTASQTPSPTPTLSTAATSSPVSEANTAKTAATITYGANGFSPASTTISSGQSVTFTNTSSSEVQVNSNPHPIHTDDSDLNVGIIGSGKSMTVVLTKKGNFGIHNHLNPSDKANITIQ